MENQTHLTKTRRLVESALMVAVATVLSIIPIADLPYGGSITVASMFPIVLVAYRSGLLWGLGSGLVYGVVQQLLGLKNLSYFTTWQSILAIILLDYLVAFAVIGFAGVFRKVFERQSTGLCAGALLACVLRYICHVISGATVWAGLSIPDSAALAYSLIYNATYMLPETIVLLIVAFYLGSLIDFRKSSPVRLVTPAREKGAASWLGLAASVAVLGVLIFDVSRVFVHMQDAESGEFNIAMLKVDAFVGSFWFAVMLVSVIGIAVAAALWCARVLIKNKRNAQQID